MAKQKKRSAKKKKAEEEFVELEDVVDPKEVGEEIKEETPEPEPVSNKPKSKEELTQEKAELIQKLKKKKDGIESEIGKIQYAENVKLLTNRGICQECGTNLNLDPETYLQEGIGGDKVICPNCHMINKIRIKLLGGTPYEIPAKISIRKVEYAWNRYSAKSLTNEQLVAKLVDEARRIDRGRNKETPVIKALIKVVVMQQEQINELQGRVK